MREMNQPAPSVDLAAHERMEYQRTIKYLQFLLESNNNYAKYWREKADELAAKCSEKASDQ